MYKVKNKDFEEYKIYREEKNKGLIIDKDAIKIICKQYNDDPVKIGEYILKLKEKI